MRTRLPVLLLLLTIGVVPLAGRMAPVVWTLSGVTFDDGGTASGTFTYDVGTNSYSSVAITTTNGTTRSGASYAFPRASSNSTAALVNTINSASDQTGLPGFLMVYATALSDLGGTIGLISPSLEATCSDPSCALVGTSIRVVTAGTVTTVTVPAMPPWIAAGTTLLLGLIAAGFLRRKSVAPAY